MVGIFDGVTVGLCDGIFVGFLVGFTVGARVGGIEGNGVGDNVVIPLRLTLSILHRSFEAPLPSL